MNDDRYSEAIKWLIENEIPNAEGQPHQIGDDIEEQAERKMVDTLNVPVFLTHFPVEIKAFYMKKDPEDMSVTESADLLLPSVGEIVGGSMRMDDYDELMTAYKREGIDPTKYVYYTDQRKYGTSPHGGKLSRLLHCQGLADIFSGLWFGPRKVHCISMQPVHRKVLHFISTLLWPLCTLSEMRQGQWRYILRRLRNDDAKCLWVLQVDGHSIRPFRNPISVQTTLHTLFS